MNLRILNLGAGVQSTTLFLMACRGVIPKYDACIFADTQWEPKSVYEHLGWLLTQAAVHSMPIIVATAGNLRADSLAYSRNHVAGEDDSSRWASLPWYTKDEAKSVKEQNGIIRRQCTSEYKIKPIEQTIRRTLLGMEKGQRVPAGVTVEQHIGISSDEVSRVRGRDDAPWKNKVYPLCRIGTDILPFPMSRADCKAWLAKFYPDRTIPRSACIGCPFHSDDEWIDMRDNRPGEWADAVAFDYEYRKQERERERLNSTPYLHDSRVPLDQAVLVPSRKDQGVSLWRQECLGMCGV